MVDRVGQKRENIFPNSVGLIRVLDHYPVEYVSPSEDAWDTTAENSPVEEEHIDFEDTIPSPSPVDWGEP